jgi:hypothetical protein
LVLTAYLPNEGDSNRDPADERSDGVTSAARLATRFQGRPAPAWELSSSYLYAIRTQKRLGAASPKLASGVYIDR